MLLSNADKVAMRVQDLLKQVSPELGARVRVLINGIRQTEGVGEVRMKSGSGSWQPTPYWHVPVLIDPEEPHLFRFYELLSDVEDRIRDEDGDRVLLIPAVLESRAA